MNRNRAKDNGPVILDVAGVAKELGIKPKTVYLHAKHWAFMMKLPGSRRWHAHLDNLRETVKRGSLPGLSR